MHQPRFPVRAARSTFRADPGPGRTVADVGEGVHDLAVGHEVLGWLQDWSAHAEFAAVPADQLIRKPTGLPWDVAGSLFVTPMAGSAAVHAVKPLAGEVVVVAGASGGVGLTAVQLSRSRGATVIGIVSQGNAGRLEEFGAVPVAYGADVWPSSWECRGIASSPWSTTGPRRTGASRRWAR